MDDGDIITGGNGGREDGTSERRRCGMVMWKKRGEWQPYIYLCTEPTVASSILFFFSWRLMFLTEISMQFGSQRSIINHDFPSMVPRFFGVECMVHGDVGKTWSSINGRVCFVHDCFFVPFIVPEA